MFRPFSLALVVVSGFCLAGARNLDTSWGDLGDATFANPVLNADYSDPDVIRVGDKYYMTCSEFHFMGMPILESEDMVNWSVINRVHDHLDFPEYSNMERYAGGTWAPALRFHDGKFWIFVCTPHEGLFMTTATDPAGEWSELFQIKSVPKWEDPCPFWDDDGQAYLGRSQHGAGPIILHKMSPDGKQLLDEGVTIYEGPVAEGTKFYKKDGWYYLSIPEGGVGQGWQTVLRAKNIYGPYEGRRVLETGCTSVNGPHQGALVDTPDGDWWFYHFQETPVLGRVVHLQPVKWIDGFPIIGEDYDGNGIGEPMKIVKKPDMGISSDPHLPQTSDFFDNESIGLHWQFNHNPVPDKISCSDGWLCLESMPAESLKSARNQLTQKLMGYSGTVLTCLDCSDMTTGGFAGVESLGKNYIGAGVTKKNIDGVDHVFTYIENNGSCQLQDMLPSDVDGNILIKYDYDVPSNTHNFYYSLDGIDFIPLGDSFQNERGNWKGVRTGIYHYNDSETSGSSGKVKFDFFDYKTDGKL